MNVPAPTPPLPAGRAQVAILAVVGLGTFMSALDGSVVNIVLPLIARAFHADVSETGWVVMAYLLIIGALLLSFGRLGDLIGTRRVFLVGLAIFGAASAWCAFATSLTLLVAARAAQAIGGAMVSAVGPAILTQSFPASLRGRALGYMSMLTYAGLSLGPVLGGLLAQRFGWGSVFLINVPVSLFALLVGGRVIPRRGPGRAARFDVPGAVLWAAALGALLLDLSRSSDWGFGSARTLSLASGAAVLLALFLWRERTAASPMIDLSLFKPWRFTAPVASAFANYVALFDVLFATPFLLETGLGISPGEAGLVLTAMPVIMAVSAPIAGEVSDRVGTFGPAVTGLALLALGVVLLHLLPAGFGPWDVGWRLGLCGLGTGIFISPNTSEAMGSAPLDQQGSASGIVATARTAGMVVGVALTEAAMAFVERRYAALPPGQQMLAAYPTSLWPGMIAAFAGLGLTLSRRFARPSPSEW